jgi:hypothetical protein
MSDFDRDVALEEIRWLGKDPSKAPKGVKATAKPTEKVPTYRPTPHGQVASIIEQPTLSAAEAIGGAEYPYTTDVFDIKTEASKSKPYPSKGTFTISFDQPKKKVLKQLKKAGRKTMAVGGTLAKRAKTAGAIGATVGAVDTIKAASKAKEEGGSFTAGFGKFVEQMTGFPSGSSGRPLTEKEKKSQWEM